MKARVSDTPGVEKHTWINENNQKVEWHHDSSYYQWLGVMREEIATPGKWSYAAWLATQKAAAQAEYDKNHPKP